MNKNYILFKIFLFFACTMIMKDSSANDVPQWFQEAKNTCPGGNNKDATSTTCCVFLRKSTDPDNPKPMGQAVIQHIKMHHRGPEIVSTDGTQEHTQCKNIMSNSGGDMYGFHKCTVARQGDSRGTYECEHWDWWYGPE